MLIELENSIYILLFYPMCQIANTNGSSAVTPITSANASPVTSRSSIAQNESFGSDIVDPPLSNSATGSVVSY